MEAILFVAKILLSSVILVGASWLAGKNSIFAGFIIALPLFSDEVKSQLRKKVRQATLMAYVDNFRGAGIVRLIFIPTVFPFKKVQFQKDAAFISH